MSTEAQPPLPPPPEDYKATISACNNCKSAHKGCDKEGPPCGRCVEMNMEKSCAFSLRTVHKSKSPRKTPNSAKKKKRKPPPDENNNSSMPADGLEDDDHTQTSKGAGNRRWDYHDLPVHFVV
jgi:hypothetical protein